MNGSDQRQEDERAIRQVIETWLEATAANDTPRVLQLMADDVVFLVAGREPFGKAEFAASAKGLQEFHLAGKSDIREIEVAGDWAWVRSHLVVTATPRQGGAPVQRTGPVLSIFRRQPSGKWVLARDANLLGPPAK